MAKINKIKVGSTLYDIEALNIGTVSSLDIESNENHQTPELTIKSNCDGDSETVKNDADIKFIVNSNKSVATNGKVEGSIGLNTKGNLSVESLNKHVNIEAKKSIQLKPTEKIIIDTSRRTAETQGDNEAIVETKYDDMVVDSGTPDYEKYGYLKLFTRAIDLRTFVHGGIALQPCGIDNSGHENKIKFESSRKVNANTEIPSTLRRDSSNYSDYYSHEGGKGVEFATFNNEHTSIYTKDYRFNKDGVVYSVTRPDPTTVGDKTDYETQADDFKDIPVDDSGTSGVYNGGKWKKSSKGNYLIASTWNSIVKTAHALNDQSWTNTNISKKGNLQITVSDEVEWRELPEWNGNFMILEDNAEPKISYVNGQVYKIGDNYYICQIKSSGEHHLNLEADSTIKLESGYNDIELGAGDKIQLEAGFIQQEAKSSISISTTPIINTVAFKVNKYGATEGFRDTILDMSTINNFRKSVYVNRRFSLIDPEIEEDLDYFVRIPLDNIYIYSNSELVDFEPYLIVTSKPSLRDSEGNSLTDGNYFIRKNDIVFMYEVSDGKGGKKAKICKYTCENGLNDSGGDVFTLDPLRDYSSNGVTFDSNVTSGYHVVPGTDNNEYIISIENHNLSQFIINNNGGINKDEAVYGYFLPVSNRINEYDYNHIMFGGDDQAESNEVISEPGHRLGGDLNCYLSDIITLINYFKNGEGQSNGPWSNNNSKTVPSSLLNSNNNIKPNIDFSSLTDEELLEILQTTPNGLIDGGEK